MSEGVKLILVLVGALALLLVLLFASNVDGSDPPIDAFNYSICGKRSKKWPQNLEQGLRSYFQSDEEANLTRGWQAGLGEFPWHVSVRTDYGAVYMQPYDCGGIIIHHNLILTTAHCVRFYDPYLERRYVIAGLWHVSLGVTWQIREFRHLKDTYWPAAYPEHPKEGHDMAIIKLNASLEYNEFVRPACLHSFKLKREPPHKYCLTMGYGRTKLAQTDRYILDYLIGIPMRPARCNEDVSRDGEACWQTANKRDYPDKPCFGDSGGGGLYCLAAEGAREEAFYAIGTLSHGYCFLRHAHHGHFHDFQLTRLELRPLIYRALGAYEPALIEEPPVDAFHRGQCGKRWSMWPSRRTGVGLARRISSGWSAGPGEFPWHVGIRTNYSAEHVQPHDCAGVIIHENLVLTAASCLHWPHPFELTERHVVAGSWAQNSRSTWQRRTFNPHRDTYRPDEFAQFQGEAYDVAVIRVSEPFVYNEFVQPVCLQYTDLERAPTEGICLAVGQGRRDNLPAPWPYGNLYALLMSRAYCEYGGAMKESCWSAARPRNYPGKPCAGDEGSGLYCEHGADFYVSGVYTRATTNECISNKVELVYYADLWLLRFTIRELIKRALEPPRPCGP